MGSVRRTLLRNEFHYWYTTVRGDCADINIAVCDRIRCHIIRHCGVLPTACGRLYYKTDPPNAVCDSSISSPGSMASPATPDAQTIASALAEVKLVYSPTLIGFIMATAAYGIGVLQCYLYFKNYPKDNIALKITVCLHSGFSMVDTAATALMAFTVYDNAITHFGDLAYAAIINPPWENLCQTLLPPVAWQIWGISRNAIATGIIVSIFYMIVSLSTKLFVTYHIGHFTEIASLATRTIKIVSGMTEGTSSLCDILITTTLIYILRSTRMTGISATERMIHTLILYIIARGVLTATLADLGTSIRQFRPNALNVRQSVRGNGQPENCGDLSTVVFDTPHSVSMSDIRHQDEDTLGPRYYVSSVLIYHCTPSLIFRQNQ
ncbi:hypothetical protein B0H10DRAFT_2121160 [Mycena sp. CBHHK59/15]|nr:hypothetical protein B0H10DRAFT_2121160 [Mycena sp. CBHHK59/15]